MKEKIYLFILVTLTILPISVIGQKPVSTGKNLYQLKCGRCHFAYLPETYSGEEWETFVHDMRPLAGLSQEDESKILAYLQKDNKSEKKRSFPSKPILSGYLYTEFFSSPNAVDTFDIHYLNMNLTGRLHEKLSYRAEFELEHGGGKEEPPFVEQAYLDLWLARNMALRIGAILTPFNRFDEFHGPLENLLVTRPQMSREIGVSAWKEVGVSLHGNIMFQNDFYISYDAYVINGLGSGSRFRNSRHYRDNNDSKSFGFRVSGVLFDHWEGGLSYYHGAWDDEGKQDLNMYGLHFLGNIGELDLFAEYSKASSENPKPLEKGNADGFFIQASYLIRKEFRPTIRYGTLDYLDPGNLLGRKPTNLDKKILAVGLNYYLTPAIVFKIEYDFIGEGDRIQDKDNNLLALQAAIRF